MNAWAAILTILVVWVIYSSSFSSSSSGGGFLAQTKDDPCKNCNAFKPTMVNSKGFTQAEADQFCAATCKNPGLMIDCVSKCSDKIPANVQKDKNLANKYFKHCTMSCVPSSSSSSSPAPPSSLTTPSSHPVSSTPVRKGKKFSLF
jgi:hypothetical protein